MKNFFEVASQPRPREPMSKAFGSIKIRKIVPERRRLKRGKTPKEIYKHEKGMQIRFT